MKSSRTIAVTIGLALALASAAGAHAALPPRFRVTAHLPATNIAGEPMRIHGRVSPHAQGTHVRIRVRAPGESHFRTLRTAYVHADGRYHARIRATAPGVTRYRVVEPAGRGHRKGSSPVQRVTVSQWRTIASLPRVPGNHDLGTIDAVASVNLNGSVYTPGLVQRPSPYFNPGWQEYVVDGKCTQLDTWVGMSPPETGTPDRGAQVSIWTGPDDGTQTFTMAAGTGVDYYGPPRELRVGSDVLSKAGIIQLSIDDGDKIPIGWGNPMILCSF